MMQFNSIYLNSYTNQFSQLSFMITSLLATVTLKARQINVRIRMFSHTLGNKVGIVRKNENVEKWHYRPHKACICYFIELLIGSNSHWREWASLPYHSCFRQLWESVKTNRQMTWGVCWVHFCSLHTPIQSV